MITTGGPAASAKSVRTIGGSQLREALRALAFALLGVAMTAVGGPASAVDLLSGRVAKFKADPSGAKNMAIRLGQVPYSGSVMAVAEPWTPFGSLEKPLGVAHMSAYMPPGQGVETCKHPPNPRTDRKPLEICPSGT